MTSPRLAVLRTCVLGAAVAVTGCHGGARRIGPVVPVKGRVTLGGKPLFGGTVSLLPLELDHTEAAPEGYIDAQGLYALKTGARAGAPLGRYRAIVTTSGEDRIQDAQFDPVYSDVEHSPLVLEIVEQPPAGAYDLKLTPFTRR